MVRRASRHAVTVASNHRRVIRGSGRYVNLVVSEFFNPSRQLQRTVHVAVWEMVGQRGQKVAQLYLVAHAFVFRQSLRRSLSEGPQDAVSGLPWDQDEPLGSQKFPLPPIHSHGIPLLTG